MKKKITALLLVTSICMTGCMPTTLEEKKEEDKKAGKEVVEYISLDDMDFSSGHIEGVLRENLKIDADIPINMPTECGIYEISRKELEMTESEYTEYFREIINNYYEENVVVIEKTEYQGEQYEISNARYNGNMGDYYRVDNMVDTNYYKNFYNYVDTIEKIIYEYGFEYNEEFVDGIVKEFLEKCSGMIPDGMNGDYVCVHIDDEYHSYIKEKYGKNIINDDENTEKMEFYAINMYSEIEDGIYFKGFDQKPYDFIEGEITDDVCVIQNMDEIGYSDILSHDPQILKLVITEEGEIVYIDICDYYTIGEQVENVSILTAKEALEVFCKQYDGVILEDDILVKSMSLEYTVSLADELDENGYRNATLIPVWVIRYVPPLDYWNDIYDIRMTISAVDGSIYK